jgi:hypothetical protein
MFAAGDTVAFHTVGEADLEFLAAARNDPAIRRPLTVNHPSNGEQARGVLRERHLRGRQRQLPRLRRR